MAQLSSKICPIGTLLFIKITGIIILSSWILRTVQGTNKNRTHHNSKMGIIFFRYISHIWFPVLLYVNNARHKADLEIVMESIWWDKLSCRCREGIVKINNVTISKSKHDCSTNWQRHYTIEFNKNVHPNGLKICDILWQLSDFQCRWGFFKHNMSMGISISK